MGYSIRTKEYHYIKWNFWNAEKGLKGNLAAEELYDLINDPNENYNVSGDSTFSDIKNNLSNQLDSGWQSAIPAN